MFIDTHTHIYSEEFNEDYKEVLDRAYKAGVKKLIYPDIDKITRDKMLQKASMDENIYPLIGLHPTSVKDDYKDELKLMETYLSKTEICGIGECGIDLYWDKTWYKEQIYVFEYQLAIAREMNLAVSIHARKSLNEIFTSLKKYPYVLGVLHCFPGSEEDAKRAIDLGMKLGIGGVVTFKNASMAKVVSKVGLENLVLETDSPYLTPSPHRGKRNESSYIPIIANSIAELKGLSLNEVEKVTTENAIKLFKLE